MADTNQANGSDVVDNVSVEVAEMALEPKESTKTAEAAAPKTPEPGSASEGTNGTAKPSPAASSAAFKEQFKAFSKFGDTKSDGKHLTLSQSDKWMKQAKVTYGNWEKTISITIHPSLPVPISSSR